MANPIDDNIGMSTIALGESLGSTAIAINMLIATVSTNSTPPLLSDKNDMQDCPPLYDQRHSALIVWYAKDVKHQPMAHHHRKTDRLLGLTQ
jgi:hypothetical protein